MYAGSRTSTAFRINKVDVTPSTRLDLLQKSYLLDASSERGSELTITMVPKRKREDAIASTRTESTCAVQNKSSTTISVSAHKATGSSKTSVTKKAPTKKTPTKKATPEKKPAPKKARKPAKKNSEERKVNDETPKEPNLDIANSKLVEDDKSPKFTLFNKLPLELRLHIWGFAAPDPRVIVQSGSSHPKGRHPYVRDGSKVPGVLHACRESRNEFLETDDASNDVTLARRRRAHPVYKLHIIDDEQTQHKPSPVFFSCDVDTLWPLNPLLGNRFNYPFSGTACLDIAKDLKHLALHWQFISWSDWDWWSAQFPNLESVTILQEDRPWDPRNRKVVTVDCPPEIDGQLSIIGIPESQKSYLLGMRSSRHLQKRFEEQKLHRKLPLIKLRFKNQFIVNEGLIPPQGL